MLVFTRSYLASYDARMGKFFRIAERLDLPFSFIGWKRDGKPYKAPTFETLYEGSGRLGARWGNALAIIGWNFFLFRTLWRWRDRISVVHAVDLDTALVAWLFCRLAGKRFIFDVYDKYTAVRSIGGPIGRMLDAIERYLVRHADLALLAGEDRFEQMRLPATLTNCIALENVPLTELPATALPKFEGNWRIGYFGVLEPVHRGLEDLMRVAAERDDVELHLAGYGGLEPYVTEFASQHANIHYHGTMPSEAGLSLMSRMHVIAGMYYRSVPNHAFAAPNKYFEHLMLGRGMLTTAGTSPGRKVEDHSTGWAVAEGEQALRDWLDKLRWTDVEAAGTAARRLWDRRYRPYFEDHYVAIYGARVADMVKARP